MSNVPPTYSNYPRGPHQQVPNGRPPAVYFDVIGEAWNMMGAFRLDYAVAALIYVGLALAVTVPVNLGIQFLATGSLTQAPGTEPRIDVLIFQQIAGLFFYGFNNTLFTGLGYMALKQIRGQPVSATDVFAGFRRFGPIAAVSILQYLLQVLGLMCCLIPGIYLVGVLAFAPLIALDQGFGPMDALQASYQALRRDAWAMFALIALLGILSGLGACACGIGVLVTLPLFQVGIAMHYSYYFPTQPLQPPIGPTLG